MFQELLTRPPDFQLSPQLLSPSVGFEEGHERRASWRPWTEKNVARSAAQAEKRRMASKTTYPGAPASESPKEGGQGRAVSYTTATKDGAGDFGGIKPTHRYSARMLPHGSLIRKMAY